MQYTPDEAEGDGPASELYDSIATVASKYGDPGGKYASFITKAYTDYPAEPWFFWDQPLSDSGLAAATPTSGGAVTHVHSCDYRQERRIEPVW